MCCWPFMTRRPGATCPEVMLPAVGQGAIGVEIRADDAAIATLVAAIDHERSTLCVTAERALLSRLGGTCHTPIAALAELDAAGTTGRARALVAAPDGTDIQRVEGTGPRADAGALGEDLGVELRVRARHILDALEPG